MITFASSHLVKMIESSLHVRENLGISVYSLTSV